MSLQTVRIPELQSAATLPGNFSLQDKLPLWKAEPDKTGWISIQLLIQAYSLAMGTGGATPTPSTMGGYKIYEVPASDAGNDTANLPEYAGLDFLLFLEGRPLIKRDPLDPNPDDEYEVLVTGGFHLLQGAALEEGSRYGLQFYELIGTSPNTPPPAAATSLFSGVLNVTANKTMGAGDLGKLVQLRSGNTQITLTLPALADVPANSVIVIEAIIGSNKQNKVAVQGGTFFYLNGTSYTAIYISKGESIWLFRGTDGFYVLNGDYAKIYTDLANPTATYKVGLNELLLDGSELFRADYPRLWECVQTLGGSIVDDATWHSQVTVAATSARAAKTYNPYRGCFSTGDGLATFRLPDLNNLFLRGLKTGSDTERAANVPGVVQLDDFEQHKHGIKSSGGQNTTDPGRAIQRSAAAPFGGETNDFGNDGSGYITSAGGTETKGINAGVLYVTKY